MSQKVHMQDHLQELTAAIGSGKADEIVRAATTVQEEYSNVVIMDGSIDTTTKQDILACLEQANGALPNRTMREYIAEIRQKITQLPTVLHELYGENGSDNGA